MIREADEYVAHALEALVDQILFGTGEPDPAKIAGARDTFVTELGSFERASQAPFLLGSVSAVDFTLYPLIALVLRMQDRKQPDLAVRERIGPRLRAWMAHFEALPCFARTYPPHWKTS